MNKPPKKKRKKKGDAWGVDKQKKNPWEFSVDTTDEPKVAAGIPMPKQSRNPDVPYHRRKGIV